MHLTRRAYLQTIISVNSSQPRLLMSGSAKSTLQTLNVERQLNNKSCVYIVFFLIFFELDAFTFTEKRAHGSN